MNAAEKPKLKPANDNPWYLLATLYGEWNKDSELDRDIEQKNRSAWNRWFAKTLSGEQQNKLQKKGVSREELAPWTPEEERELAIAFTTRSGRTNQSLPDPTKTPDFSHTIFDSNVSLKGFFFLTAPTSHRRRSLEMPTSNQRRSLGMPTLNRRRSLGLPTSHRRCSLGLQT